MGTKSVEQQRLMHERARALAVVQLTRHAEVVVEDVRSDVGIDLLVQLHNGKREGLRQLGVNVKVVWESLTLKTAEQALASNLRTVVSRYGPFPFPVVLLLFSMEDSRGWYTWVAEPIVSDSGLASLPVREKPSSKPLDDTAVEGILQRVNHWYDAHYRNLTAVLLD